MRPGPRGFTPSRGALLETIAATPQLHDPAVPVGEREGRPSFTTPPFATGARVRYEVLEYDPLLDSANLELSHWARFAEDLGVQRHPDDTPFRREVVFIEHPRARTQARSEVDRVG